MKTIRFLILLLLSVGLQAATTFTEFYVQTTGANTNSGSTTGDTAVFSAINGNWTNATATFYKSGLNPEASVAVGDWAAVYADAATVAAYLGKVTARSDADDTITLSLTAMAGTDPGNAIATMSISVGGAWKGPNAAVGFPFDFASATMTNASAIAQGYVPRVNFKSGTTYDITAALTHTLAGPIRFQGYTTTPGDLGKATIKAITTTASYIMLAISGVSVELADMILWGDSFTSGTSNGINLTGYRDSLYRVVVHDVRGNGFSSASGADYMEECEAYNCGESAGVYAGFVNGVAGTTYIRCFSHDNAGTYGGFSVTVAGALIGCIADSNSAGPGFRLSSTLGGIVLLNCDAYNNNNDGVDMTAATVGAMYIQNCNLVKNGGYGINSSGSPIRVGTIRNCGFGSGTMVNASGAIAASASAIMEIGTVTYAADQIPWSDAPNLDFRITLTAAKGAGRGSFTTNNVGVVLGYPDIGAGQHYETATTGGETSHTFAQ